MTFEVLVDVEQLVADRREHDAPHVGARERRIEHVGVLGKPDAQRGLRGRAFRNSMRRARQPPRDAWLSWLFSPHEIVTLRARRPNALPRLYQHRARPARPRAETPRSGAQAPAERSFTDLRGDRRQAPASGGRRSHDRRSRSAPGARPCSARSHAGSADADGSRAADRSGSARRPAGCAARAARRGAAPGSPRAAPACRDGAATRTARRSARVSTMRPRYITATRSAMCFTTARSCEMKM